VLLLSEVYFNLGSWPIVISRVATPTTDHNRNFREILKNPIFFCWTINRKYWNELHANCCILNYAWSRKIVFVQLFNETYTGNINGGNESGVSIMRSHAITSLEGPGQAWVLQGLNTGIVNFSLVGIILLCIHRSSHFYLLSNFQLVIIPVLSNHQLSAMFCRHDSH